MKMGGNEYHYVKSDPESQILHVFSHMQNLELIEKTGM
jgi:hypothetical protein